MKTSDCCNSIEEIRSEIDRIDKEIISLLGERFQYVKAIVAFKEPSKEGIVAQDRYNAVIASRRALAEECGLDANLIEKLYRGIMDHFIEEEMKIINLKK